jgi:glycosyltransferase involved in cell wall biosynthesis
VVRSGPDTRQMRPVYPTAAQAKDRAFSLAYLGIMGPQDGVDLVLELMSELVHRRHREDVSATLLGFGDCYADLRARCTAMGLDDYVTFTGRADKAMIADHLSVADLGLCPDLKTPLNDVSTMNKTMEYMSYALPSVAFDLVETRVSGADSVLYVPSGDVVAFADAVERLLDDPELRIAMARRARERVSSQLDWRPQAEAYLSVYQTLTGRSPATPRTDGSDEPAVDQRGRTYVPFDDDTEFERFIRERSTQ